MAQVAQPRLGNTHKSRTWCFTVNNPTEEERKTLAHLAQTSEELVWQLEEGDEKTPHIQGCVKWKHARRFSALKNQVGDRFHLEKCRNWKQSVLYCRKLEGRLEGPYHWKNGLLKRELIDRWDQSLVTEWQTEILQLVSGEPSLREIYWRWECVGKTGKTTLARHLYLKGGTLYLSSGKGSDIKYAMAKLIENNSPPSTVLFDLPRTAEQYISWDALESLKNGIMFSGKYESACVAFPIPHVIVLANFPPDETKLSVDRWNVEMICV